MITKTPNNEYRVVATDNGFYKIVDSSDQPITNQIYKEVDLFNYQRNHSDIFTHYPTDAPIDLIFAVKETANWSNLKSYYLLEFDGLISFIYNAFSLLHFYIKVKLKKVDRWKYINKYGKPITKAVFEDPLPFVDGISKVRINMKWGLIDKEGFQVIPPIYDNIEFVFNFNKFGYISNLAYIKVRIGTEHNKTFPLGTERFGLYSLNGAMLIPPICGNLDSINWKAVEILKGNRVGYLTERGEEKMMQLIPLEERIKRLPTRHLFVCFDYKSCCFFLENGETFDKISFNQNLYTSDFNFLSVSYKTGTITMVCENSDYEMNSDGDFNEY